MSAPLSSSSIQCYAQFILFIIVSTLFQVAVHRSLEHLQYNPCDIDGDGSHHEVTNSRSIDLNQRCRHWLRLTIRIVLRIWR